MTTYIIGDKAIKREVAWSKKAMKIMHPGVKLIYKGFNLESTESNLIRLVALFDHPTTKERLTYNISI